MFGSSNHQQQQPNLPTLTTPSISIEQFAAYQLRQEEIERNRMRETMNNMIQTFFPGCNYDINTILPNSSNASTLLQPEFSNTSTQFTSAASVFQAFPSSTRRELPRSGENNIIAKSNISKLIPWANILSLQCKEPINFNETFCNKELANEDDLQRHQYFCHGILKFRCLSKNCNQSFDQRKLLQSHIVTIHTGGMFCRVCPKRLQTSQGLEGHYQLYHQKGIYQCIRCKVAKEYLVEMRKHTKMCSKNSISNFVEPPRNLRSSNAYIEENNKNLTNVN